MSIRKIKNQWWVIVNGQPKREATEEEIKRLVIERLIKKFQTA